MAQLSNADRGIERLAALKFFGLLSQQNSRQGLRLLEVVYAHLHCRAEATQICGSVLRKICRQQR